MNYVTSIHKILNSLAFSTKHRPRKKESTDMFNNNNTKREILENFKKQPMLNYFKSFTNINTYNSSRKPLRNSAAVAIYLQRMLH